MEEENRTENNCFRVKDLKEIAGGKLLPDKKTIQYVLNKIGLTGTSSNEKICPWDPAIYSHEIPTLILSGTADPITAGGQAQYFYENGLDSGKRALIEFPGVGHLMSFQGKVQKEPIEAEEEFTSRLNSKLGSIWGIFLASLDDIDDFLKNRDVKKLLDEFGANFWP